MAILYDVPAGQALFIDGPCTVRITAADSEPTIDDPANITPAMVKRQAAAKEQARKEGKAHA
jgi:hypothetical protein